ncbi:hypothetical protein PV11_08110 [Exophiala sideris]|uniref:Store-operated calcium entry-associated regulatory factor n=1 Tax=Exophiala sideris TaxID=1016849 RepID=A0A0D1WZM0_9EURO|nr:hypothetical protein PV11_08110 [Exophiala sideris]
MKYLLLLTLLFISTAFSAKVTNPKKVPRNAALLSKISAITVRAGKQTASRRVSPVPQLKCVGPAKICSLYSIDTMRCTNEGVDYDESNVQWSCKAALPDEFKLGSTDVTCEGYESSEDPYVLKGSCGVEYRLLLTDKGEEKYGSQMGFNFGGLPKTSSESIAGYVSMALFALVLFIILRGLYRAWRDDTARPRPRGGGFGRGGGGGGGDGGDDDPPPPYDSHPPPRPKKATWTSGSSSASSSTRQAGANQEQGWRPGFWTGTAAGAAAAYMAGRSARTQPEPPRRAPWEGGLFGGRRDQGPQQGGWFGGGGGGAAPRPSSRTTSSSPSFSSTRHESTGFGGTSRR